MEVFGRKRGYHMKFDYFRRLLINLTYQLDRSEKKLQGVINKFSKTTNITLADCFTQNWKNVRPAFVLSTGRSGTLLLNRLLLLSPQAFAVHQPKPELIRVSKLAYEKIYQSPEVFEEVFRTAREELMFEAVKLQKVFIETNNHITFFAPIISKVFPNAVFLHLVRHPGDFIRSGIRRRWYSGMHDYDLGRIVPVSGEYKERWKELSDIEKIGWLWNETNQFIDNFKKSVPEENFSSVKAEDLFKKTAVTKEIFDFLKLNGFNERLVQRTIKNPVNVQRKGHFPPYKDWNELEKRKLKKIAVLAENYGYIL